MEEIQEERKVMKNWYKIAKEEEQGDLFEGFAPKIEEKEESKEKPDIQYLGPERSAYGVNTVKFKIGNKVWQYIIPFADWVDTIGKMAVHSPGKALAWAKERKRGEFDITDINKGDKNER